MRVHACYAERDGSALFLCRAVQCNAFYCPEFFHRIFCQHLFMLPDILHSYFIQVVYRRAETYDVRDIRSSCLELPRQIIPACCLLVDFLYHVASAKERRRLFEKLFPPVKHAYSGRSEHLMAGECKEVAAKL